MLWTTLKTDNLVGLLGHSRGPKYGIYCLQNLNKSLSSILCVCFRNYKIYQLGFSFKWGYLDLPHTTGFPKALLKWQTPKFTWSLSSILWQTCLIKVCRVILIKVWSTYLCWSVTCYWSTMGIEIESRYLEIFMEILQNVIK